MKGKGVKIVVVREATGLGVSISFWALPKEKEASKYKQGVLLEVENVFGECRWYAGGSPSLRSFLQMNGIYLTTTEMMDLMKRMALDKDDFERSYGAVVEVCEIIVKDNEDSFKGNVPERIRKVEEVIVGWYEDYLKEARKISTIEWVGKLEEYEL